MVFAPIPNRPYHEAFMRQAINMAELALASDETPVGCVFVHQGEVIGRGINGTNASLNVRYPPLPHPSVAADACLPQGTRHAEFVALAEIMAKHPQAIIRDTDLYVTVEPCIMCASALRQYGIRAVYFGCLNDRFGGCGGVMNIHADASVDRPFPVYGGLFREEAIMLLRRFYVQENDKGAASLPVAPSRNVHADVYIVDDSPRPQTEEEPRAQDGDPACTRCHAVAGELLPRRARHTRRLTCALRREGCSIRAADARRPSERAPARPSPREEGGGWVGIG